MDKKRIFPSAPPPINPNFIDNPHPPSYSSLYSPKRNKNYDYKYDQKNEDIYKFAQYLNINLDKYPYCLKYVIEAIISPLPKTWKEYTDDDNNTYYYNKNLDYSTWEHPTDQFYKNLIKNEIKKNKKKYLCF